MSDISWRYYLFKIFIHNIEVSINCITKRKLLDVFAQPKKYFRRVKANEPKNEDVSWVDKQKIKMISGKNAHVKYFACLRFKMLLTYLIYHWIHWRRFENFTHHQNAFRWALWWYFYYTMKLKGLAKGLKLPHSLFKKVKCPIRFGFYSTLLVGCQ